jgi:acyl carrier protein
MKYLVPVLLLLFAFGVTGCEIRPSTISKENTIDVDSNSSPSTTFSKVREIVAAQMGVAVETLTPTTSLDDLAADELDFVELIMELEESFSITITDATLTELTADQGVSHGLKRVTIERLVALVDAGGKL